MPTKLIENYYSMYKKNKFTGSGDRSGVDERELQKLDPDTQKEVETIVKELMTSRRRYWTEEEMVEVVENQPGWQVDSITTYGYAAHKDVSENMGATIEIYQGRVTDQDPYGQDEAFTIANVNLRVDDW